MSIHLYLEKLERLLDPEHIERTKLLQKKAFNFEPVDHIPTVISYPLPEDEWPAYGFNEIFNSPEKMLIKELAELYKGAKLKDDGLPDIRPNFGTGIIASMFGCETKVFGYSLPIGLHVSEEKLEQILEQGIPDLNSGIFGKELFDIQGTPNIVDKNIEFASQALDYARKYNVLLVFETIDITCSELFPVLSSIDNASFAIDLNVHLK